MCFKTFLTHVHVLQTVLWCKTSLIHVRRLELFHAFVFCWTFLVATATPSPFASLTSLFCIATKIVDLAKECHLCNKIKTWSSALPTETHVTSWCQRTRRRFQKDWGGVRAPGCFGDLRHGSSSSGMKQDSKQAVWIICSVSVVGKNRSFHINHADLCCLFLKSFVYIFMFFKVTELANRNKRTKKLSI